MHSSQKLHETNEAILLCVCVYVNVFSFISPWNSSAFFHVIHIEERIELKMKMSVWVRAVCIWNVHVHALCMYWLCACLCAWEKVTKKSNLETKKTWCYGNAVSRHMREWLCIWFLFMFTLEMITSVTWMK